jgi:hypothetical protein
MMINIPVVSFHCIHRYMAVAENAISLERKPPLEMIREASLVIGGVIWDCDGTTVDGDAGVMEPMLYLSVPVATPGMVAFSVELPGLILTTL